MTSLHSNGGQSRPTTEHNLGRTSMDSKIGRIKFDRNFSRWIFKWSDLKRSRRHSSCSVQSPNFDSVIGTCCFSIQLKLPSMDWEITYVLKLLKISSSHRSRPIKLFVSALFGETLESEWITDEEPHFEFKVSEEFKRNNTFVIACKIGEQPEEDFSSQPRFEDLSITQSISPVEETKDDAPRSRSTAKLIGDLKEILLNEMDTDVLLKVEGKEFKAHRLILRMRSPVFFAMFEHDMREKNSGVVAIEDCDPQTFPDFLHYIYTGTVQMLTPENAPRLYVAADKYQLLELKEECLEYMKKNVSVENFCDFMGTSLRHHETELTRIATQFFLEKAADIVVTTKWMKFLAENVVAGNELIVKLADNRRTK